MTGRDGGVPAVAGGPARHIPVLGPAALGYLHVRDGGVYVDATFGAGGYSRAILAAADCRVIGIDRDPGAIDAGADLVRAAPGRFTLVQARFSALDACARAQGHESVDGVVLDIGVSSMQLDEAARGFSFRNDGPLDMRMGGDGPSAADVIATIGERDLANVIFQLGEERHSRAIARALVQARRNAPVRTTAQLARIVSQAVRARPGGLHPATRTFQALRIFVNEELHELANALAAAEHILRDGGRLVVVSFHSLEDRIVKTFLAGPGREGVSRHAPDGARPAAAFRVLTKKPVTPDADEVDANPRARSAKLRAGERTAGAAGQVDLASLLPRLPALAAVTKGRPA
ncbi:MAG: 16S rRNA (cytosine(1402)-N(4))-methyltransferase RsmH [Pseudorhodoplanes sp.]|nr:MAG: 16S rRNA (cytosine(1402)-N(4))-methyltransferase RsmH [Pseudorhodoplanes sp.]